MQQSLGVEVFSAIWWAVESQWLMLGALFWGLTSNV